MESRLVFPERKLVLLMALMLVHCLWMPCCHSFLSPVRPPLSTRFLSNNPATLPPSLTRLCVSQKDRENEIRRKINALKKQGRLKKTTDDDLDDDDEPNSPTDLSDEYGDRIRSKLGDAKSKLLGFTASSDDEDSEAEEDRTVPLSASSDEQEEKVVMAEKEEDETTKDVDPFGAPVEETTAVRRPQLGALPVPPKDEEEEDDLFATVEPETVASAEESTGSDEDDTSTSTTTPDRIRIDPSLFEDDEEPEEEEIEEEDLVELVAEKLAEKRRRATREKEERIKQEARARLRELQQEREQTTATTTPRQTTTGIGGSWAKNETAPVETYQPKVGSWGAFPRPKDISRAYGGGRRVGPGYSNEQARADSAEQTREKLKAYREKVGIDVQSEKDHATEIDEALKVAGYAMQRGIYNSAVKALESVTKFCSTNSRVGGKVFLELAMAYEAVGRTEEAVTVYRTLSKSRIEEIKSDAKRLLYGIEAMQVMRDDLKLSEFSRKKAKNTFIDTTGLANIAQNFDDVYNTAYIDMEGSFYKRLTESVVRGAREARQILLKATDAGEIGRARVVQALRSISRRFEDALDEELARNAPMNEPVAVMDGKPIVNTRSSRSSGSSQLSSRRGSDDFVLMDGDLMAESLDGEWRLQLVADKRGDGVKYFNSTLSWQQIDMERQKFDSTSPSNFLTVKQSGGVEFNEQRRILSRKSVKSSGGGMLGGLFKPPELGAVGAVSAPQQVMTVDSVMLVTRRAPSGKNTNTKDDEKDYFAVWRRVEPGTYSARP